MRACSLILVLALGACTAKDKGASADSAAARPESASMAADPDRPTAGGGIPAGYIGRTDRANTAISGARYVSSGNAWEVTTGPAHIVYSAKDLASGTYTVSSTFDQLEKPAHPEAFGVFIGGRNLDQPNQSYTYFLVRGSGEMLAKVREGDATRDLVKWTASPTVPKEDASGKATYKFDIKVGADSVWFNLNGNRAAAVARGSLPATDGIAGLRINHNLHVRATPVTISK